MIKSRLIMPEINQEFDVQYNENAQVCDVITDTLMLYRSICEQAM